MDTLLAVQLQAYLRGQHVHDMPTRLAIVFSKIPSTPRPWLPLFADVAVRRGDVAMIEFLLSRGLDPAPFLSRARTARAAAALIRGGARVDRKDTRGLTPLMVAVRAGNIAVARELLINGDPSKKDRTGTAVVAMTRDRKMKNLVREFLDLQNAFFDN